MSYLIREQSPRVWDDGVWQAVEMGNLYLFSNSKCRQSHMTKPGTKAGMMLDKGLPPAYVVQHATLE